MICPCRTQTLELLVTLTFVCRKDKAREIPFVFILEEQQCCGGGLEVKQADMWLDGCQQKFWSIWENLGTFREYENLSPSSAALLGCVFRLIIEVGIKCWLYSATVENQYFWTIVLFFPIRMTDGKESVWKNYNYRWNKEIGCWPKWDNYQAD